MAETEAGGAVAWRGVTARSPGSAEAANEEEKRKAGCSYRSLKSECKKPSVIHGSTFDYRFF